ncbi:ribose-phosphate diphosphokinase [Methylobacter sp.]|uniref:ribose-phosphate diphosphokinase n=1 Tax=Methylobacter sp. TaxID=2051955 RepID=UPI0012085204|nr:ribose-phosphate diphosphokinase [Methylobacter sp.]TAK64484.1 MAG: ribose-phosphate diphosphokinase [Methylobacter sp.]
MLILAFPDYLGQAQRLATRLDVPLAEAVLHHFPDGESLIRLPPSLPEHVIVCRSLNQPNDKLIELLLCATTARELGAKRLTLVAPYLSYMRQDIANQPGEAVSQRIIGKLLANLFDDVLTVDPHLHRISSLTQAIPIKNAISLTAANEIGTFLQQQFKHAVLLGPDSESEQWVAAIASNIGFDYAIADKNRLGDKQVEMTLPDSDFCNRPVIIIDDMASTGRTLAKAAGLLQTKGCKDIYTVVTHALFCDDAYGHILKAGIKTIWSTDSIDHPSSCIKLDALLADAIKEIA